MSTKPRRVERYKLEPVRAGLLTGILGIIVYLSWQGWEVIWGLLGLKSMLIFVGALVAMLLAEWNDRRKKPTLLLADDGVSIEEAGKERFISHADIEAVTVNDAGDAVLEIALLGGDKARVGGNRTRLKTVAEAIEAARERHRESMQIDSSALAKPREGDESVWLDELRAIAGGARWDHRHASLSHDDLWALVESPATAPERRVAAAVALASRGRDERKRLRIASGYTASKPLRIAIEEVAEAEDEQALLEALSKASQSHGR